MSTILVVEYDHDARVALRRALEDSGYSVISRTDARDALEVLRDFPSISLVVLEWAPPGSRGAEFLERKGRLLSSAQVPVIVVADPGMEVVGPGVVAVLYRPLDLRRLLEHVKRHCQA